ncbi:ADP-ribosylglycohydrolase family protein [Roseateles sp. SL47]|uniref:ADP-ribosylglycohydrolase family protein n=1 Tax=Roseateles sp. SL47 TaxID=2995138 RepID=UPI00226ED589|nr:ADP-ribosylglycohydrolase family protein [Roseateles sp. SL47]WAC71564.1 ADP-ribosylglycohydrolase family protein [Roseateles sp. SL47]
MNQEQLRDRIQASLTLAGMGDALGAPTEQWSIDEIAATFGGLVTRFETPTPDTFAGVNGGLRAEVTDDASQMYYLARALVSADGRLDQAGWVACLLDWVRTSPKAGFMGPSTAGIVKALQEGTDLATVGVIGQSRRKLTGMGTTNGSAMRVAPVGLIHPGDLTATCEQAFITCLPSHDTEVAISAACSIASAVSRALVSPDVPGALDDVLSAAVEGARRGEALARERARVVAGPRYLVRLEAALSIAMEASDDLTFMREMEALIGNSVLAAESVPVAVGIVAYTRADPLRTIAIGASIGNDTDSIATMAGAIVGAWRGMDAVPGVLRAEFEAANRADFNLPALAAGLSTLAWRHLQEQRERRHA